eukprot:11368451-Prorocentrum_lima.AAC.1
MNFGIGPVPNARRETGPIVTFAVNVGRVALRHSPTLASNVQTCNACLLYTSPSPRDSTSS